MVVVVMAMAVSAGRQRFIWCRAFRGGTVNEHADEWHNYDGYRIPPPGYYCGRLVWRWLILRALHWC